MGKRLGILIFALVLFVGFPSKSQAVISPWVMGAIATTAFPFIGQVGGTWLTAKAIETAVSGTLVAVSAYPVATVLLAGIVIESGLILYKVTKSSQTKESPQILYTPYYPGIGAVPYPYFPSLGVMNGSLTPDKKESVLKYRLLPDNAAKEPKYPLLESK